MIECIKYVDVVSVGVSIVAAGDGATFKYQLKKDEKKKERDRVKEENTPLREFDLLLTLLSPSAKRGDMGGDCMVCLVR